MMRDRRLQRGAGRTGFTGRGKSSLFCHSERSEEFSPWFKRGKREIPRRAAGLGMTKNMSFSLSCSAGPGFFQQSRHKSDGLKPVLRFSNESLAVQPAWERRTERLALAPRSFRPKENRVATPRREPWRPGKSTGGIEGSAHERNRFALPLRAPLGNHPSQNLQGRFLQPLCGTSPEQMRTSPRPWPDYPRKTHWRGRARATKRFVR
jgi:hypothetical protein